jgi:hypothetical protein
MLLGNHMSDALSDAIRLIGVEVERANRLFPDNEAEAICELLRRSNQLPDLKREMLVMCATNVIDAARRPNAAE